MDEYTMVTTADADFHLIEGDVASVRMKVEKNHWLPTMDGRYVQCSQVVAVWTPSKREYDDFMAQVEAWQ